MKKITSFGIGNYKLFKDTVKIDFGAINILTGKNNSGKSSFISSMKFLNDFTKKEFNALSTDVVNQERNRERQNSPLLFCIPLNLKSYNFIKAAELSKLYHTQSIKLFLQKDYLSFDSRLKAKYVFELIRTRHFKELECATKIFQGDKNITSEIKDILIDIEHEAFTEINSKIMSLSYLPNRYGKSNFFETSPKIKQMIEIGLIEDDNLCPFIRSELEEKYGYTNLKVMFSERYKALDKSYDMSLYEFVDNISKDLTNELFFFSGVSEKYKNLISTENPEIYKLYTNHFDYNNFGKTPEDEAIYNTGLKFIDKYLKLFDICSSYEIIGIEGELYKVMFKTNEHIFNISELGSGVQKLITLIFKLGDIIIKKGELKSDWHFDEKEPDIELSYYITKYWEEYSQTFLILEEPESNLHPDFQSKLADLIVEASTKYNIQFLIETHSEYLIRKLQYLVAKKECKPEDINLYYFTHPDNLEKGEEQVRKIEVREDGSMSDSFGKGFYDEATTLKFDLLRLNRTQQN